MTRTSLTSLLCLAAASVAIAAPAEKPAWRWSNAERIAARTDSSAAKARVQAFTTHTANSVPRTAGNDRAPSPPTPFELIDGNVHPELFFPTELFRHFVLVAFVMRPNGYAQNVREYSSDLFRTPAEMNELEAISAPYTAALRHERDLLGERAEVRGRPAAAINAELATVRNDQCHAMASALRNARQQFGAERFDRFLYEVATRNLTLSAESKPDANDHMTPYLRNAIATEEGCQ